MTVFDLENPRSLQDLEIFCVGRFSSPKSEEGGVFLVKWRERVCVRAILDDTIALPRYLIYPDVRDN